MQPANPAVDQDDARIVNACFLRLYLGLAFGFGALACNVYDAAQLERPSPIECGDGRWGVGELCDTAIAAGEPGACPDSCDQADACRPRSLSGEDCDRECVTSPIVDPQNGDGCCPDGVGAADDSDCGSCGDGVVGPGEACDPPESCPNAKSCRMSGSCFGARLTGDPKQCTARCELEIMDRCEDGDGCCPGRCNRKNDDDCSASCGNGVVESAETCEVESEAACATRCEPVGSCMAAVMSGSPENCNVECLSSAITDSVDDDACCPPGAHALSDSDCPARCGNGVVEPGETCDGGDYCHADCTALSDTDRCQVIETARTSPCPECTCEQCSEWSLGCFASGDAERDRHCIAVVGCARDSGCVGDACYCGTSPNCAFPNGPCRLEIEAAALAGGVSVSQCENATGCATYWARNYGECRRAECAMQCQL
jgi:hypothetical protein